MTVHCFAVSTIFVTDCQVLGLREGLKQGFMQQISYLVKHSMKVCTSEETLLRVVFHNSCNVAKLGSLKGYNFNTTSVEDQHLSTGHLHDPQRFWTHFASFL